MLKFFRVLYILLCFVLFLDITSTTYTSCSCDMFPPSPLRCFFTNFIIFHAFTFQKYPSLNYIPYVSPCRKFFHSRLHSYALCHHLEISFTHFYMFHPLKRFFTHSCIIVHCVIASGYPGANQSSPWAESQDRGIPPRTFRHLHPVWPTVTAGISTKRSDVQKQTQTRSHTSIHGPKVITTK